MLVNAGAGPMVKLAVLEVTPMPVVVSVTETVALPAVMSMAVVTGNVIDVAVFVAGVGWLVVPFVQLICRLVVGRLVPVMVIVKPD
jgi:hypothetical protein